MGQCRRGILVDERAGGYQMGGDTLGVARVKPPQGATDRRVKTAWVHPLGDLRARGQRWASVLAIVRGTSGATRLRRATSGRRSAVLPGVLRAIALRLAVLPR
ncbi:MAG TPA: hypothetical protein VGP00_00615, partial [Nocardioides sp.]|nr:hypothetical protein [Nocardioides sp.]